MAGVQETCSRIAMQTGRGLAATIRMRYPRPVLYGCVALLVGANTFNIGADLGAMASAARLLAPGPFPAWLAAFAAIECVSIALVPYRRYASLLRWLCLSLLTYVAVVIVVPQDWRTVAFHTVVPALPRSREAWFDIVAVLGTTISPYLFFWQAALEVEERTGRKGAGARVRRGASRTELRWRRADVGSGMFISNLIMWCVIVATASTLHHGGGAPVETAEQAAAALKPVAGAAAAWAFALGILGTGLLAVPVLAGSTAFAVAETLAIREGLELPPRAAPGFYAVIVIATVGGAALDMTGLPPMRALVDAAVLNGLAAPPLLYMILRIGGDRRIMHARVSGPLSAWLGWTTFAGMVLAALALVVQTVRSR